MNGVDAVVLATGNDFRAMSKQEPMPMRPKTVPIKVCLTVPLTNGVFKFWLDIPLALGTVGGLTSLHPMAKLSLEMLQKPSANQIDGDFSCCGLSAKFCCPESAYHQRNSARAYENAPAEYFKSVGSKCPRERKNHNAILMGKQLPMPLWFPNLKK